jgi:hypothetical protein
MSNVIASNWVREVSGRFAAVFARRSWSRKLL